jgi:uncharacterized membrane protein YczE
MASECVEMVGLVERPRAPAYARFVGQLVTNVVGLFLFALGVVLTLRSGLGLGPWDVLHQGISRHTPLTFGQASQLVGAVVIGVGLVLRVRPGLGTVLNMLLIGFFVDRLLAVHVIPLAAPYGLAAQLGMDVTGVLLVGLGSGLYIRAKLGAGPRDGLMLGLHRVTGVRVAVTRAALEITVAIAGFLLGGTVGIGTLVFALGVGPAVELGFRVFGVSSRVGPTPARQGEDGATRHS